LQWFGLIQLPESTILYIKKSIEEFTAESHFSEYGWE